MLGRTPSYIGYSGGPAGGQAPASLGSLSPQAAAAARVPGWGQSFDLIESAGPGGVKRPRISGDFASSMPYSASEGSGRGKRARYGGGFEQQASGRGMVESFESAIARAAGYAPFMGDIQVGMPRMNMNDISTPGFYTNGSTPDNEIVLKKLPYYQTPGENDAVFIRRRLPNEEETYESKAFQIGYAVTAERVGFTLPGINRFLALGQKNVTQLDDYKHFNADMRAASGTFGYETVEGRWETASDIMRFFYLAGVVNSEVFASGESSVDRVSTGTDPALLSGAKKVNVVMQGRAFVHNIWGAGLRPSTILWFILKRVGRRAEQAQYVVDSLQYVPRVDSISMELETLPTGAHGDTRQPMTSKNPWQFLPWASTINAEPSDADLAYYDDFGHIRYGLAIPFGMVNKIDIGGTNRDQGRMPFDLRAIRTRNILDVILFG